MVKLLVIADDFTGALDTGIQFNAKGTLLQFGDACKDIFSNLDDSINVLIIDTESRHLSPKEAGAKVYDIVCQAVKAGVPCIYKKTDSGLRGNIGSELSAVLSASNQNKLHFIPAYPQQGRTTKDGIHYIDGIPVAKSVFGADPFEPVKFSDIKKIIAQQSTERTCLNPPKPQNGCGICIYDAENEDDLESIAQKLKDQGELHLLAGCAGFAAVLPNFLGLDRVEKKLPDMVPKLLTICGSINRITLDQLDEAETKDIPRIRLNARQKLDKEWIETQDGKAVMNAWTALAQNHTSMIIDCDGLGSPRELEKWRQLLGLNLEEMRCRISEMMGAILKGLLDRGLDATLLVTGGDTLMAFMQMIEQKELIPIQELTSGVVLSQFVYRGKPYNLLSKSGGFGSKNLLSEIENILLF